MTVFCTTSFRGQREHQRTFESMLSVLQQFPHVSVISPYLRNTYLPLLESTHATQVPTRYQEYQAIRRGIRLADAVIFETSYESFQIGYEVNYALVLKKPTLCLSEVEDFSKRIEHDYFFGAQYNSNTMKPQLQDFLSSAQRMTQSQRFNLFLYPHQLDHIESESQKHGMNMSEYVRYLINKDKS